MNSRSKLSAKSARNTGAIMAGISNEPVTSNTIDLLTENVVVEDIKNTELTEENEVAEYTKLTVVTETTQPVVTEKTTNEMASEPAVENNQANLAHLTVKSDTTQRHRISANIPAAMTARLRKLDTAQVTAGEKVINRNTLLSAAIQLAATNPDHYEAEGKRVSSGQENTDAIQGRVTQQDKQTLQLARYANERKRGSSLLLAGAITELIGQ